MTATWKPVGVDYCTAHHGLRNEDDEWCNWREDPDINLCETCDGEGEVEHPEVWRDECPDCGGFGYTPCELQQLGYLTAEDGAS